MKNCGEPILGAALPSLKRFKSAVCGTLWLVGLGITPWTYAVTYSLTDLGTLGGTLSYAFGINNVGQVVGQSYRTGDLTAAAVLWTSGAITELGSLGGTLTWAYDINDSGQIVGDGDVIGNTAVRALLWSGGTLTDLGTLGGAEGVATSINDAGQVVGRSSTGVTSHATLWSEGTITDLDPFAPRNSSAEGINASGQVAGWSENASFLQRPVLWASGTMTDLGTLGGARGWAEGINNAGQVVGTSFIVDDATAHATLWSGGSITDLGTLGGLSSSALAINSAGLVVGFSALPGAGGPRAFLWDGCTMTDVNALLDSNGVGWTLQIATAINDAGQIVGSALNASGETHAYLLSPASTPVPRCYIVAIDIKPGTLPNSITLKGKGVVPVAILSSSTLNVVEVDVNTVLFAGASSEKFVYEDVNSDGVADLVLHFRTQDLHLTPQSTEATLTGKLRNGDSIIGTDSVSIVPPGGKSGKD